MLTLPQAAFLAACIQPMRAQGPRYNLSRCSRTLQVCAAARCLVSKSGVRDSSGQMLSHDLFSMFVPIAGTSNTAHHTTQEFVTLKIAGHLCTVVWLCGAHAFAPCMSSSIWPGKICRVSAAADEPTVRYGAGLFHLRHYGCCQGGEGHAHCAAHAEPGQAGRGGLLQQ